MFDEPVDETVFFSDEVKLIYDLISDQWSLYEKPKIVFEPESIMVDSRVGSMYIYPLPRRNTPSSVDYRTMQRVASVGIRLSTRFRNTLYEWGQEIYRILLANRRIGAKHLGGYTFMEIVDDVQTNATNGWYVSTFTVRLTGYAVPIKSAGFGDRVNKIIECNNNSEEYL